MAISVGCWYSIDRNLSHYYDSEVIFVITIHWDPVEQILTNIMTNSGATFIRLLLRQKFRGNLGKNNEYEVI